jgi:hypothetical protein
LGADAVVGVDIDHETVGNNILMVSASGTEVKLGQRPVGDGQLAGAHRHMKLPNRRSTLILKAGDPGWRPWIRESPRTRTSGALRRLIWPGPKDRRQGRTTLTVIFRNWVL